MSLAEAFGMVHAAPLKPHAMTLAFAARDVATGTQAADDQIAQLGLSLSIQAAVAESIRLGGLSPQDIAGAFATAFVFVMNGQGRSEPWTDYMIGELGRHLTQAQALVKGRGQSGSARS